MIKTNLANKNHSMTNIIASNLDRINACTNKSELYSTVQNIFVENELDTAASNRLLANIKKKSNFTSALQVVYDSYLCGSKLAVDQK